MGKSVNEKNNNEHIEQSCVPKTPTSPLDLSINSKQYPFRPGSPLSSINSSIIPESFRRQMSLGDYYEPPVIVTQPKNEWHYRSIKDLAKNHLPYLAGNGPQRTPVRVAVPKSTNVPLYLAMTVVTIENELHPSKVIVPAKTHVNTENLTHDNNLDCLRFNLCSENDKFDLESRIIYSEITPADYQREYKEVRVHMFNLYQSHVITKDMITSKELNRCKLAFWLCVRRDTEYKEVSQLSFSNIIEEKKMTSRPRTIDQMMPPTTVSFPYSSFMINCDDSNEDYMDDDSSS